MQGLLSETGLGLERDDVYWSLQPSGKFSTRSLYKIMPFGGVKILRLVEICFFLADCRIQCGLQLTKRNWSGLVNCVLCDPLETTGHILL